MRMAVSAVLAGALILSLGSCAEVANATIDLPEQVEGELPGASVEQLNAALTDAMALSGASGAIAGVWAPWSGTWVTASGTTEPGGGSEMSTDMHFRIADNTKPMTCEVLFALVDEGVVSLDDNVTDYLPDLVGVSGITFGQLCQSTSGISDSAATFGAQFERNPTREWARMELVADGVARRSGTPGAAYAQSDTGYILLGLVLESVMDETWPELYDRYIFEPLGLNDSSFPGPANYTLPSPAASAWQALPLPDGTYACDAPTDQSKLSNSMMSTAGGVVSTIEDLHAYSQALATGALRGAATKDVVWQTIPLGGDHESWQEFAQAGAYQFGPMRGQFGSMPGQMSAMLTDPESGLTVVVMLNNSTAGVAFIEALAMKLAAIGGKAEPAEGRELPAIALPWSQEQMSEQLAARAVCQPAAPPAE
ncbi:serine hydrolase domain-containing protein [Okibacterium endophyticum]